MKIETAINRIISNKKLSDYQKQMRLYSLAFKTIPGSLNQDKIKKVIAGVENGNG